MIRKERKKQSTKKQDGFIIPVKSDKKTGRICKSQGYSSIVVGHSATGKVHVVTKSNGYKNLYEQEIKDINSAARTLDKYRID